MYFTALPLFFTVNSEPRGASSIVVGMEESAGAPARALDQSEQRELVDRILGSELFHKSGRLSAFLKFVCEQHWKGRADTINEQRIGTVVFQRAPGYHVGDDSIVRSQARFLRQRLEEYFNTVGAHETLLLTIPKGSYFPVFERRQSQPAILMPTDPALSAHTAADAHDVPASSWRFPVGGKTALALLFLVVLAAAAFFWKLSTQKATQTEEDPSVSRFWSSIFDPRRPVLIVPADSSLVLMEELNGHSVSLSSYINKDYMKSPSRESAKLWDIIAESQYTNMADLNLVARLEQVPQASGVRSEIRYARNLSLKELKDSNSVLIGGPIANPWVALFATAVHFDIDYDWTIQHNFVRNRAPAVHEQPLYVENQTGQSYGVVAYVPSLDGLGHTLLVEGTSKAGTEAGAEFLTSSAFASFLKEIGADKTHVPNFELLLSTQNLGGDSHHPVIACWHKLG